MPTKNQILNNARTKKIRYIKLQALNRQPQIKGICVKVFTRGPKKPNSAVRKVAKVKLWTGKCVDAYIPGEGHSLQQHSIVLLRGGRVPDLPGVKYHLIRGNYDFPGLKNRTRRRSLYATKNQKSQK